MQGRVAPRTMPAPLLSCPAGTSEETPAVQLIIVVADLFVRFNEHANYTNCAGSSHRRIRCLPVPLDVIADDIVPSQMAQTSKKVV